MDPDIFHFAVNPRNHDLESPESLHDAWLTSCCVVETPVADRASVVNIELQFLGPNHDRDIHLSYASVRAYRIESCEMFQRGSKHGDLLIHEMRIESAGVYEHEFLFFSGASIFIQFEKFAHIVRTRN